LSERNPVNREDNQYRFRDIVDLDSGKFLFTIEHEVRSLTHPMFLRPLVNRNPTQTARNYSAGYDGAGALRRPAATADVGGPGLGPQGFRAAHPQGLPWARSTSNRVGACLLCKRFN
jgi:hypothetical protein